ncbi:MAG: hypothetical protein ACRCUY_09250 [Thermoguttaceae bacterium]
MEKTSFIFAHFRNPATNMATVMASFRFGETELAAENSATIRFQFCSDYSDYSDYSESKTPRKYLFPRKFM